MISEIKAIGFDLDNTLYKITDEINELIREYACIRASEELGLPYAVVRNQFNHFYSENQSGSRSLMH